MIRRIWHGWTTPENADAYERLLVDEIFVGIRDRKIPGLHGIELLRRDLEGEVEFLTILSFESLASIREFVGEDCEVAYVPEAARKVLSHFDERARHYEVRAERPGQG